MDANDLQMLVFELLSKHFEDEEPRKTFVGLQGEAVIVMQANAPHFGLEIVPAQATVPA